MENLVYIWYNLQEVLFEILNQFIWFITKRKQLNR